MVWDQRHDLGLFSKLYDLVTQSEVTGPLSGSVQIGSIANEQ